MLPEWGHFALIMAMMVGVLQSSVPWVRGWSVHDACAWARGMATLQWCLIAFAFITLAVSFYTNDLSVVYVAQNAHHLLPTFYRVAALWGGHEGSFLLWIFWLATWGWAVAMGSRALPPAFVTKLLSVMGMVSAGFMLFVLSTSNPFLRYLPWVPAQGQDLNPLLQDPGLVMHPPVLYAGYVGFAVAFAWAMAVLWEKRLEPAWAAWLRPWVLLAWACLTYGIVLGSWWAYRELGWGGWWFWDPVENASLMPWLAGTALLHALISTSAANPFRLWALALSVVAFALSLLGTFLVRSGVLVSVHAFAMDPTRGVFMLVYMAIVVGSAMVLWVCRVHQLAGASSSWVRGSREHFLWLNNVCLMVMLCTVLLGTLYPMIYQAMGWGKLSVGAPYFNRMMVWLACPFFLLMGWGPHARWQRMPSFRRWRVGLGCLVTVVGLGVTLGGVAAWPWRLMMGLGLAVWLCGSVCAVWWRGWVWPCCKSLTWSRCAMSMAHLGVAVFIIGVTVTTTYSVHRDVQMHLGDRVSLGSYTLQWTAMHPIHGANFEAVEAEVRLEDAQGRLMRILRPQQRIYTISGTDLAKTAIDAGVFRDVYVALGQSAVDAQGRVMPQTWSFRLYLKPFVRWIWAGGVMMAVGALLGVVCAARMLSTGPPGRLRRPRVTL